MMLPASGHMMRPMNVGTWTRRFEMMLEARQQEHACPRGVASVPPWVASRLRADETVLFVLQPSRWWILLRPLATWAGLLIVAVLLTITAAAVDTVGIGWTWSTWQVWIGASIFALLRATWAALEWWNLRFVLTDRRVLTRIGVLRVDIYETALSHLRQTQVHASIRERCFGLGTLLLATAATSTWDTAWPMLHRPAAIQKAVEEARSSYAGL